MDGKGEKMPPSFQISRQLDQEKISFLTHRVEELIASNSKLRTSASQNEKDTHDIVLYFQREMEMKDDIVLRLNEELVKCQTQLKFEVDRVKKAFETELLEIKTISEKTITDLTAKLNSVEADLKSIELYRQEKDLHEGTIQKLEKSMQNQREQLIDAMEEQERRFLEEKSQLFKDLDQQKIAFREIALKEARSAMGEEAKKILADNDRMFEELKFHHSEAAEYQTEKAALAAELATAKREVTILSEKELEYARQAHFRNKEIKALRERVEQLEKQQSDNVDKFKHRAKELKATVSKELAEATLDAAGLRRLIHIKNKELKQMKTLAATILSQRSETEQFFLESLQEVKEVIRKEKKKTYQQSKIVASQMLNGAGANQSSGKTNKAISFPPLNIKGSNLRYLEGKSLGDIDLGDFDKVTMKDLTWEDKELVLRVLFSKMNGVQKKVNRAVKGGKYVTQNNDVSKPVFVSEGADIDDYTFNATDFQEQFEVSQEAIAFGQPFGFTENDMDHSKNNQEIYEKDSIERDLREAALKMCNDPSVNEL